MNRNGQKLFGNLKRRNSLGFVISTGRDVQMQFNVSVSAKFKLFLQPPQSPFESIQCIVQLRPEIHAGRICKKSHKQIFAKFAIFVKIALLKGTFAISFVLKIILWRIFAIFAIFVKISTLDGAPLPYHLTCSYYYGEFSPFSQFSPNLPFSSESPILKGTLGHF